MKKFILVGVLFICMFLIGCTTQENPECVYNEENCAEFITECPECNVTICPDYIVDCSGIGCTLIVGENGFILENINEEGITTGIFLEILEYNKTMIDLISETNEKDIAQEQRKKYITTYFIKAKQSGQTTISIGDKIMGITQNITVRIVSKKNWEGQIKCLGEGEDGLEDCCEGLVPIACAEVFGNECIYADCGHHCTKCGDKNCGLGENRCNCPEDCE